MIRRANRCGSSRSACVALEQLGEHDPAAHHGRAAEMAEHYGWGAQDTVLISRKPFTDADVAAHGRLRSPKMQASMCPGPRSQNAIPRLADAPRSRRISAQATTSTSRPVSDDRPFFFYTVQPRDLWRFITTRPRLSADYKINRAVPLLFGLVAISIVATADHPVLPPLLLGTVCRASAASARSCSTFCCIGAGYILIQVALIQKFVLFLGHPTYALTVMIFSMLISQRTWAVSSASAWYAVQWAGSQPSWSAFSPRFYCSR